MDEPVEGTGKFHDKKRRGAGSSGAGYSIVVAFVAILIFVGCTVSPPSLMDDVDAVQAQIAQNMLRSGDWVTARLDGIAYLEKAPLKYWAIATSFQIFGVHDWAARIPIALAAVLLCWVTAQFGAWAFGPRAGLLAGLALTTSVGLFLFTRVLIPDVMLTLAITAALYSFVRAAEDGERNATRWALLMWASLAAGVLLKGLVAVVFPIGAALLYLGVTGRWRQREMWRQLRLIPGIALFVLVAAPWHILAALRNPPYIDFAMHSEQGSYHGFFWFYFINEQLLRFLNRRYPRDYNTVPRLSFWLLHLLWLFPWSFYFPMLAKLRYGVVERAARVRLLALCWTGMVLVFFTFSTTQEYYSMPCYPALALLTGSALAELDEKQKRLNEYGTYGIAALFSLAATAAGTILWLVRGAAVHGDIAEALRPSSDISTYTLSLGHLSDLTVRAFAYLRAPLALAGAAFALGATGAWRAARRGAIPVVALIVTMVLFFHAARLALVVFDPYLSSRQLAEALTSSPPGQLIVDDQYYTFSSVFFYSNRRALLLNGRVNNLEYGSYAPDAPKHVFLNDAEFTALWKEPARSYLAVEGPQVPRIERLVGKTTLHPVAASGGKFLFSNF